MIFRRYNLAGLGLAGLACLLYSGCQLFPLASLTQEKPVSDKVAGAPGLHSHRVSQFVFLSDFTLDTNLPLFRELSVMREQLFKELQLPSSNALIQVYLFEDKDRYERFMHQKYPELPRRRAFFVAQPRRLGGSEDLLVYTYWGDRIHQDLRHELTHALLHSALKDVPLWLDEGLAEYFEMPQGWNGVNYQHLENLRRGSLPTKFDMARLEQLTDVQQMTPVEYRESWAWVHYMLNSSPATRRVLIQYLHDLRTNPRPGPLHPRLTSSVLALESSLDRHLAHLDLNKTAVSTAP